MRGLPPPPETVARLTLEAVVRDARSSIGVWLNLPELGLAPDSDVEQAFLDLSAYLIGLVVHTSSTQLDVVACRWESFSPAAHLTFVNPIAFASGMWTSVTPNNCCTVCYLGTGDSGKRGHTLIHLPGFPSEFSDDMLELNVHGFDVTRAALQTFVPAVNTYSFGALLSVSLVSLQRSAHGVPLGASVAAPIITARPSRRIGHLDRRLYLRR